MKMPPKIYKPHIDGMRSVAVMAVIAYHYGATWLPGGFTGVDIFFVISGFLITSNIWAATQKGEFSLVEFYSGRIRRILPALLITITSAMIAASFVLTPGDMSSLAASAKYSALGFGNFYFYANTGYFDREAELQPLLHLWSLGVEEQFYLLWPVSLLAISLFKPTSRTVLWMVGAAALMSIVLSEYQLGTNPKAAFYLPGARAWELLSGALIAFIPKTRSSTTGKLASAVGVALVIASLFLISTDLAFPGVYALPAVLGTALIILPKEIDALTAVLSFRPIVWIGKISYSLYLWHWPVLVLFRHYANGEEPRWYEALALFVLTLVCAAVSWRIVETPIRNAKQFKIPALLLGGTAMVVTSLSASLVTARGGLIGTASDEARSVISLSEMWEWRCPQLIEVAGIKEKLCVFGEKWELAPNKLILWGDSHADHMAPLVESVLPKGTSVLLVNNCPAALGGSIFRFRNDMPDYAKECSHRRQAVFDIAHRDKAVRGVIFAGSWVPLLPGLAGGPDDATGFSRLQIGLEEAISGLPKKVVIIGQFPRNDISFVECRIAQTFNRVRRACPDPQPAFEDTLEKYGRAVDSIFNSIAKEHPGKVRAVSVEKGFCASGRCLVEINGEMIYRDSIHIRRNLTQETKLELAERIDLPNAIDWLLR
jgi:peptidoglycan/LPS O-acetylase OafA/YrhL